ncbi:MAG: alpha/beta hydrolase [Cyanobacteria bacterium P01_C01_bin.72]
MGFELSVDFIEPREIDPQQPLFVYLPGMDGTGRLLQTQSDDLAVDFDLRCITIRTDNYSTWQDLARDTVTLIKAELAQKTNQEVYLCGESFGGCLALRTALAAPDLISKLILVNPASSFNQLPILSWGSNITGLLPSWIHRYSAVGLLPFLASLNRISDCDRDRLVESMKSIPPHVVSWRLSLLRDFKILDEELRSLDIPSLILAGAADGLLPSVEEAEKLTALLPRGQMTVLPQSGHACLLETNINLYQILLEENFIPAPAKLLLKL